MTPYFDFTTKPNWEVNFLEESNLVPQILYFNLRKNRNN